MGATTAQTATNQQLQTNIGETNKMLELQLMGEIVPKARPRVTYGRAYMPQNYRDWKECAIADLAQQYQGKEPMAALSEVSIALTGKHSRRGDLDNIAGAILDALVQARILANDNLTVVPKLSIGLSFDKKKEPVTTIQLLT
jgi:Holliday junction resolvase RusA-like endonuclease